MEDVKLLQRLDRELVGRRRELERIEQYLEMEQPLKYMAPALEEEFGDRVTQLIIDLPSVVVEAYESVLDVQGFTVPNLRRLGESQAEDPDDADARGISQDVWQVWTENHMQEQMPLLQHESIGLGSAYLISGPGESADDVPVMSVESPFDVHVRRDPRTRRIDAAIKRWAEPADKGPDVQWGTLYLPGSRITFRKDGRDWVEDGRDDHGDDTTRVVAFPNRPRLTRLAGKSEFAGIIPTLDAINKMATDMMVSGEFHAMPRRYAFGLRKEDFQDEQGNPLSVWKQLAGGVWSSEVPGNEINVGQFDEADLAVFHNSIKLLLQLAFMQVALPSHISAFQGDNPASADAIRAAEIQKVKRSERKQTVFGGALEEAMRNNWMILGRNPRELVGLETTWRNPATPTKAQEADASVKLVQAKVIPPQQARVDLNYSEEQRRQMDAWDRANAADPFFEHLNRDTGPQDAADVDGR